MKALVVEDDVTQLNGVINILSDAFPDITLSYASDYDEAVELIDREAFDFYLLDIELNSANPEKTGIVLGEYIRSIKGNELVPILFLTALAYEAPNAINKTHCYDYLVKPYDREQLINSVTKLLDSPIMLEQPLRLKGIDGVYFQIYPNDIICIKSDRRTMNIYTIKRHLVTNNIRLEELLRLLPSYIIRCHKSYAINIHHIDNVDKQNAIIKSTSPDCPFIPISRNYYKILVKELLI